MNEEFDYSIKGLFATKIGDPEYMEVFITEGHDDKIEKASAWAKDNGFDRLRIVTVNGNIPNFAKTIRRTR